MPDAPDPALLARARQVLDDVVDPCSATAGAPAGLVAMGLVRAIDVMPTAAGARIKVTLALTEPGCMMGALFEADAVKGLSALDGVAEAVVEIDYGYVWSPADMTPEYRERLARHRRDAQTFSRPLNYDDREAGRTRGMMTGRSGR